MATRPEDVETARGRLERDLIILTPNGMSKSYRMVDAEDLRTILASHTALTEAGVKVLHVVDCLTADAPLGGAAADYVAELRALLSGKASA